MKNAITKKSSTRYSLVTIAPWAEAADIATKITHLDQVVRECGKCTKQAAIMCGWLLSIEKTNRQGGFVAWAEANLPISTSTVYNYMALFERAIANNTDNFKLECSEKSRQQMVESYAETVESKTLTDLYIDLDIVKKSKSNLGGKREGAGRKPKAGAAEAAAAAADAPEFAVEDVSRAAAELYKAGVTENGFAAMTKGQLKAAAKLVGDILRNIKSALAAK